MHGADPQRRRQHGPGSSSRPARSGPVQVLRRRSRQYRDDDHERGSGVSRSKQRGDRRGLLQLPEERVRTERVSYDRSAFSKSN